jgi:hypothetical protein
MALFSKWDKDMPLISQFYQLEITPSVELIQATTHETQEFIDLSRDLIGSELDVWLAKVLPLGGVSEPLYSSQYAPELVKRREEYKIERGGKPFSNTPREIYEESIRSIGILAQFQYHLKPLMNGAADRWKMPEPTITDDVMKDAVNQVVYEAGYGADVSLRFRVHVNFFNKRCKELTPSLRFSMSNKHIFTIEMTSHKIPCIADLIYQFKEGIDKDRINRCIECECPFLMLKEKQSYCSVRCSGRAIKRRRRQEGKKD